MVFRNFPFETSQNSLDIITSEKKKGKMMFVCINVSKCVSHTSLMVFFSRTGIIFLGQGVDLLNINGHF